jgi:hypothetical protein
MIELAKQRNLTTKIAVVKYLKKLLVDCGWPFVLVLSEETVVPLVADVLGSGTREMKDECLDMLQGLSHAAMVLNVDFRSTLEFEDVVRVPPKFEGKLDDVSDRLIALILGTDKQRDQTGGRTHFCVRSSKLNADM